MSIDQAFAAQRLWEQAEQRLSAGQLDAARSAFEAVLALQPGHAGARLRLVTIATAQGRYRDSIVDLLELAASAQSDAELLPMLAGSLHRLGESAAARACLARPALAAARDRALLEEGARTALQLEDLPVASRLVQAAERHGGAGAESCYLKATIALFEGRIDTSEQLLEASVAAAPRYARAHWSLARLRTQTSARNHVARLRARLAQAGGPGERAYLGFALFKELDDLDDRDGAWAALIAGCENKRSALAANPATRQVPDEAAAFDALASLWTPGARAIDPRPEAFAATTPVPIFIVGMPRTGTTLLERILARTGGVTDAGELDDLPLQLRWLADRFSRSFADADLFLAARAVADPALLRRRYLAHAAWRGDGRPWFTDKLPMNFLNIGFIAEALPEAPILHMVRNPMDTCFSNLKELFAEAYPYSYAFDTLAAHYGRYRRLMSHWHRCFPGRILDVPYEGLVSDTAAWTERIRAHCGIDAVTGQQRADANDVGAGARAAGGVVTTASTVQVREPIHTRSIQAWRRYAAPLEPLRLRLQDDGWLPG